MDLAILKKKLSSYRTEKGRITKVSDELLGEILKAWEEWTGPATSFYTALGTNHKKLATLIGKAKKLKREGAFPEEAFKEIKIESNIIPINRDTAGGIEVYLRDGQVIKFYQVSQLIEFLSMIQKLNFPLMKEEEKVA